MAILLATLTLGAAPVQNDGRPPKKLLFIADLNTGVPMAHDASASRAAAVLEQIGHETGDFDLYIQTSTDLITKAKVYGTGDHAEGGVSPAMARNLDDFDAVAFYTNGDLTMSDAQLQDLLRFIGEDGKGFVGIHSATATMLHRPAYGAMIGGAFDNHPWGVTTAPIIIEDPANPSMRGFRAGDRITDEFYQMKAPYDRSKLDVLARVDVRALDPRAAGIHRTDADFPIAWIKRYGKGRVFYSDLGHTVAAWDDPRVRGLYIEGIRWALGEARMTVTPHAMPPTA